MAEKKQTTPSRNRRSMEPEWIDLDQDFSEENTSEETTLSEDSSEKRGRTTGKTETRRPPQKSRTKKKKSSKKKKTTPNLHVILLAVIALVFVVIAFKLIFWDSRTHKNSELENDTTLSFDTEALDSIVPLDASNPDSEEKDDDLRILFLGNGSLADQKESDTNLANIVQAKTGATVYNCAIADTYMSARNTTYLSTYPYDAFSFYYLCTLFAVNNTKTLSWGERDLGGLPEDVKQSTDLLQSIDYDELDVLCIYYDGSDYLKQCVPFEPESPNNITTFCGALNSGLDLVKNTYPHIRIIVMSPTFLYVVDEDGNYISSYSTDILEQRPLPTYVGLEAQTCIAQSVSFVDNLYGSVYEEIADEYLKDNILLNEKGHELLADRFLYALNRFHNYDF